MASPLQNRIVGTLIVIALAIIILPDLLSGRNVQRDENLQVSPLRPQLDTQFEEAEFPEDFQERSQRETTPLEITPVDEPEAANSEVKVLEVETAPADSSEPESQPVPESESEPDPVSESEFTATNAWVIQLGAFRNQQSVVELVNNLKAEGFPAYTRRTQGTSGELHLLLVGPDLERDELERQLPALKELTRLDGRIVRYQPAQ